MKMSKKWPLCPRSSQEEGGGGFAIVTQIVMVSGCCKWCLSHNRNPSFSHLEVGNQKSGCQQGHGL